jgi:hypothetical protein
MVLVYLEWINLAGMYTEGDFWKSPAKFCFLRRIKSTVIREKYSWTFLPQGVDGFEFLSGTNGLNPYFVVVCDFLSIFMNGMKWKRCN